MTDTAKLYAHMSPLISARGKARISTPDNSSVDGKVVVPVIVLKSPGMSAEEVLKEGAKTMLEAETLTVRCPVFDPHDFLPLPVLRDGKVEASQPSNRHLRTRLASGNDIMLILDEATAYHGAVAAGFLQQAASEAKSIVYAVLVVSADERAEAEAAIARGLGVLPDKITVLRFLTDAEFFEATLRLLSHEGMDERITTLLRARGDYAGSTVSSWIKFDELTRSPDVLNLDPVTREAVYRSVLGDEAYDAYLSSKG